MSNLRESDKFYNGFLSWLGYERILSIDQTKAKDIVGWRCGTSSLYLTQTEEKYAQSGFHRRHVGLNHIAFWATSRSMVDRFYKEYLLKHEVRVMYGGPKEYKIGRGWYSLYFEDPDRIKIEVLWTPT